MPIFYFDSKSFLTARAIYTDADLTLTAPNGWYTSCGYARQAVGGVLQSPVSCSSTDAGCVVPCGQPLTISPTVNTQGVFDTQVDLSQKVGAVRIEMDVLDTNTIVGFFAQLEGQTYPNTLDRRYFKSHPTLGILSKPYIRGVSGDTCNASGSQINSIPYYKRAAAGGWILQTGTLSEFIVGSDAVTTTTKIVMYVPKSSPFPTILNTRIIQPCPGVLANNNAMKIFCPELLSSVNCSSVSATATGGGDPACSKALTKPLYQGPVNGVVGTDFGLCDWVFQDANSVSLAPDGVYKTAYTVGVQSRWISVQSGIVNARGLCP